MLISELMAKDLAMESAMTRSLLSKVPSDKVSWKPNDDMHTIGWNANHLAETLNGVPDSVMDEPWSLKMGGHVLFTMNKGDCLRKWVFSHSTHHRGILSVYLRMAGVPVTSVYEE